MLLSGLPKPPSRDAPRRQWVPRDPATLKTRLLLLGLGYG